MPIDESLIYINSSGERSILTDGETRSMWELRNRSGFTAPDVELITQKYVNGIMRVIARRLLPRTVRMNFVLVGQTTTQRDTLFFELVEKLMNVSNGENGKLYVKRSNGQTVVLNCAYSSGLNITDEYRKFHRFTLEFYAEDPYFYNEDAKSVINLSEGNMITLSEDLYLSGWCLGWAHIAGGGTAVNPFERTVYPVYKIAGSRNQLKLVNSTTGVSMEFRDMDLLATDTIYIDTREQYKRAYVVHADGSSESILGHLNWANSDISMPLVSGNNFIQVFSFGEVFPLEITSTITYLSA